MTLELKARAFDRLMEVLDGREEYIRSVARVVEVRPGRSPDLEVAVHREMVHVYEWRLRFNGRRDLRQALLDEAAALLKKEKK